MYIKSVSHTRTKKQLYPSLPVQTLERVAGVRHQEMCTQSIDPRQLSNPPSLYSWVLCANSALVEGDVTNSGYFEDDQRAQNAWKKTRHTFSLMLVHSAISSKPCDRPKTRRTPRISNGNGAAGLPETSVRPV